MRYLPALALAVLMTLPAAARPLAPADSEAMKRSLDAYLGAVSRGDAEKIVAALPPRILNVFAGMTGLESDKLHATLVDQTRTLTKGTKFRDVTADLGALDAQDSALRDGTTTTWLMIPTAFTVVTDDSATRNNQPLLAVKEGDDWYFLRIDGPERQQLAALAYPFLLEAPLPAPGQ